MKGILRCAILVVVALSAPADMVACPSCYGAQDSLLTAGMNSAILVMLGITGFVLASIAGCFIFFWKRAKRHHAMLSEELFINGQGKLQENNEKGVVEWNNS